jgi:hypothetical protein
LTDSDKYQGDEYTGSRIASVVSREALLWASGGKIAGFAVSGVSKLGTLALGAEKMATATYYATKGANYVATGLAVVNAARGGYAAGEGIKHVIDGDYKAGAVCFLEASMSLGNSFHTGYSLRGVTSPTRIKPSSVPSNAPRPIFDKRVSRYRDTNTGRFIKQSNIKYPDNRGASWEMKSRLDKGKVIDRYGDIRGQYAGQPGATISQRGLPSGSEALPYNRYKVLKPIHDVDVGLTAPWEPFGASGGRMQYHLPYTIDQLVHGGYLGEM